MAVQCMHGSDENLPFLEFTCLSNRLNKHVWFLPYTEKEMLISLVWKV